MAAPRPVDVKMEPRYGPSAADVAGRVTSADPVAQAQVNARIRAEALAQQQHEAMVKEREIAASKPQKVAGFATVKAVPSADTLVLLGSGPAHLPAPEKQLTLSGINAPRPARKKGAEDEPFAWQSREFLRQLVIGKRVKFAVTYVHESSGREYGTVELENGEDLVSTIVSAGWATVKVPTRSKDGKLPPEREELVALEAAAKEAGRGIHQDPKKAAKIMKRKIDHVSSGARNFFEANRDKALKGVVDQVREGSTLRIEIPGKNSKGELSHQVILLNLAGVQCPRIPIPYKVRLATYERQIKENPNGRYEKPKQTDPEPYAQEALTFTENRLLNRDVTVRVLGCDKLNNLFGTVHVPQGDISTLLLKHGLARIVDWSANLVSNKSDLEAAQHAARQARYRIWRSYSPDASADATNNEFMAKVIQIVSPDTLIVMDPETKEESRVLFASLRAPRLGFRDRKSDPWAEEGKEYLRRRLIGRKVKVVVEYTRDPPAESRDRSQRKFVSIEMGKENIAESFVAQGFATVIRHRMDEDRSKHYDALVNAETKAQTAKKGVHGAKPPVGKQIIDLSERIRVTEKGDPDVVQEVLKKQREVSTKVKQYLPFLQKQRRVKAIVEHVFNGNRMKLYVPSQNCLISYLISGIRCPSSRGDKAEDFADEATAFTRSLTLQHEVELEVETLDKGDNFIGSVFVNRKNLAIMLLDNGLARVVPFSAERSSYAQEMFTAEKVAQQSRLRIWKNWTEEKKEEKVAEPREPVAPQVQKFDVRVSEAYDALNFFIQVDDSESLPAIQAAIEEVVAKPAPVAPFDGDKGDICLARFDDGNWYRSRVERWGDDGYEVMFIDFGNRSFIPTSSLRALPHNSPLVRQAPLARPAVLSGVRLARDYYEESAAAFLDLVYDRRLAATVDATDPATNKMHVTLVDANDDEKEAESVNVKLLKSGLVRIPSKPLRNLRKLVDQLRPAEKLAKDTRAGLWEYGDVSSDEDEEEQPRRR